MLTLDDINEGRFKGRSDEDLLICRHIAKYLNMTEAGNFEAKKTWEIIKQYMDGISPYRVPSVVQRVGPWSMFWKTAMRVSALYSNEPVTRISLYNLKLKESTESIISNINKFLTRRRYDLFLELD